MFRSFACSAFHTTLKYINSPSQRLASSVFQMLGLFILWFLFYLFDGIAVVTLIQALGNDELDFVGLLAVGVATVVLSVFLDLMLSNEYGVPGLYAACGLTAIVLGIALKLIWDVELKRVGLICVFFCAFHIGLLRSVMYWFAGMGA